MILFFGSCAGSSRGFEVRIAQPNRQERLRLLPLRFRPVGSPVMYAGHETVLFTVVDLARAAHKVGALFHTDAVQAFGRILLEAQTHRIIVNCGPLGIAAVLMFQDALRRKSLAGDKSLVDVMERRTFDAVACCSCRAVPG